MKTSLIVLAGLSGLALTIAGCSGVVQPSNQAPTSQIIPTTTPVKTETPAATEAVEAPTVEPIQAASPAEIPQPVNELAEAEYGWSQLLPRDAILPIYEPEFAPAEEVPYADDELVIGVEINGEAKAYAIGPLNSREMVNDTLGGRPILVTW
jgi:hypothetical protein